MNWKDCIRRTLVAAAVIVALGCLSAQAQWGSIRANNRSVRGNRAPEAPDAPASTTASFTFIGNRIEETDVDKRLGSSMDRCEAQPRTFRHV